MTWAVFWHRLLRTTGMLPAQLYDLQYTEAHSLMMHHVEARVAWQRDMWAHTSNLMWAVLLPHRRKGATSHPRDFDPYGMERYQRQDASRMARRKTFLEDEELKRGQEEEILQRKLNGEGYTVGAVLFKATYGHFPGWWTEDDQKELKRRKNGRHKERTGADTDS